MSPELLNLLQGRFWGAGHTKSEKGFSFIELLIAIALLGTIASVFLGAVNTNYKTSAIATEGAVAQKIASYRMINNVTLVPFEQAALPSYADGTTADCSDIQINDVKNNPINCSGYTTQISATTVNDTPLQGSETIQKVTVKVIYGSKTITSLQDYKWIADN